MIYPNSICALLEAVRLAKANPLMQFRVKGDPWGMDSRDVLSMWRRGVDLRASRGLPVFTPEQEEVYQDLRLDAMRINEYAARVRHSGCRNLLRTQKMKRLYPHIDNQPRDW